MINNDLVKSFTEGGNYFSGDMEDSDRIAKIQSRQVVIEGEKQFK